MLKLVNDLLAAARLCEREPGRVGAAGASVMSFLVLHLKETTVEIPPELAPHVKIVERFCAG